MSSEPALKVEMTSRSWRFVSSARAAREAGQPGNRERPFLQRIAQRGLFSAKCDGRLAFVPAISGEAAAPAGGGRLRKRARGAALRSRKAVRNFPNGIPMAGTSIRSFPNGTSRPVCRIRDFPNGSSGRGKAVRNFPNGISRPGSVVRDFPNATSSAICQVRTFPNDGPVQNQPVGLTDCGKSLASSAEGAAALGATCL